MGRGKNKENELWFKKKSLSHNGCDRFELTSVIGEGNFGKVLLGIDLKKNVRCAVKKIEVVATVELNLGLKEVAVHRALKHKNIVGYLGACKRGTFLLLYMDYMSHGDLKRLGMPDMTVDTCLFFFEQLVAGLKYLHGKGFFHGDIKPENLLVSSCGTIKIADFGFADRSVDSAAKNIFHSAFIGTAPYRAAEIHDAQYLGAPVDIWSAGIVLFELVTGAPPWTDSFRNRGSQSDSLATTGNVGEAWLSRTTPEIQSLMKGMLQEKVEERFTAKRVLYFIKENKIFAGNRRDQSRWTVRKFLSVTQPEGKVMAASF